MNKNPAIILSCIAASMLVFQCASTSHVTLNVMKPSPVDMPKDIKNIVLLDRTETPDKDINVLASILQGKTPDTDTEGARLCLNGLENVLTGSGLYGVARIPERMKGSALLENYPPLIPWAEVQKICAANGSDALISLEMFKSSFIVTHGLKKNDDPTRPLTYTANGQASIKAGFRIYEPSVKKLVDEYSFTDDKEWNASATTVQEALTLLVNKNNAVGEVGYSMGGSYGRRITPSWYTVRRELYTRPDKYPAMKKGTRLSQVGDWTGAIESWKAMMPAATKEDHAGRAAYNIAVSYEVLGDLKQAREWAVRSFTEYGVKKSKDYVDILDQRIYEETRVKEQTEGK